MITINLPKDDTRSLIAAYLEILNIVNSQSHTKLTDGEIKLLVEFLLLPEKYSYQRFSRYAKPTILKALKEVHDWELSTVNLNSKIYELVGKGYIWRDTDGVLYLKDFLIKSTKKLLEDKKILIKFDDSSPDR